MNAQPVLRAIAFVTIALLMTLSVACSSSSRTPVDAPVMTFKEADAVWEGDVTTWIDKNSNGKWDDGEKPLENVQLWVEAIRESGQTSIADTATSDHKGTSQLNYAWAFVMEESACVQSCIEQFVVHAEAPMGYRHTTPEQLEHEPYRFGFAPLEETTMPIPIPPTVTPSILTIYRTPVGAPVTTFVAGQSEVPEGNVVFIESLSSEKGRGACGLAKDFHCEGGYSYDEGQLRGSGDGKLPFDSTVLRTGRIIFGRLSNSHVSGAGGSCADIDPVIRLPYTTRITSFQKATNENTVIHAANAQGAVVVDIEGQKMWLEPGQSWYKKLETPSEGCVLELTIELKNHGLLDESQVEFR